MLCCAAGSLSDLRDRLFEREPSQPNPRKRYCFGGGPQHLLMGKCCIWQRMAICNMTTDVFETTLDYLPTARVTIVWRDSILACPVSLAETEMEGIQVAQAGVPNAKITLHLSEDMPRQVTVMDIMTQVTGKGQISGYPLHSPLDRLNWPSNNILLY